jgi:hypothetical protein
MVASMVVQMADSLDFHLVVMLAALVDLMVETLVDEMAVALADEMAVWKVGWTVDEWVDSSERHHKVF